MVRNSAKKRMTLNTRKMRNSLTIRKMRRADTFGASEDMAASNTSSTSAASTTQTSNMFQWKCALFHEKKAVHSPMNLKINSPVKMTVKNR
mmetsp:Transcript_82226/g.161290  ORF Transcript_82226/g.161290 Transcript_82226/m.161290 type:complete len:91 (-) Transcript_82226:229-501(-)